MTQGDFLWHWWVWAGPLYLLIAGFGIGFGVPWLERMVERFSKKGPKK